MSPYRFWKTTTIFLAVALGACAMENAALADALARLTPKKLEAIQQAVAALKAQRQPEARSGPFREYRAAIHLHSSFSHDSRGTLNEIVAAA